MQNRPAISEFPEAGTWEEKQRYVNSLTVSNEKGPLLDALTLVENANSVLNLNSNAVPEGVALNVYTHAQSMAEVKVEAGEAEQPPEPVVIHREVDIKSDGRKEVVRMVMPMSNKSYTLQLNDDGTTKVEIRNIHFSNYQTGLTTFNNGNTVNTLAIVAKATNDEGTLFTAYTKPGQ